MHFPPGAQVDALQDIDAGSILVQHLGGLGHMLQDQGQTGWLFVPYITVPVVEEPHDQLSACGLPGCQHLVQQGKACIADGGGGILL